MYTFFLPWFSVPGQVLTAQAAVEAAINATAAGEETKQSSTGEESIESEPQAKRQNLGMDFSSLVKEEVFHSQQVLHILFRDRTTAQLHVFGFSLLTLFLNGCEL